MKQSRPGRPLGSQIRQNIVELLYFLGEGYAYDVYKHYVEVFPKVSMRSVYYHLKKGIFTQEFVVKDVKQEMGEYSWGDRAERVVYALGPLAGPVIDPRVKEFFDKKSEKR
ncbi:TPA: hypothetical protein HA265_07765 [Candidatus Woesearchaeota archaeon]|nr:hypothetical protein [Candidatus Woesearchaeota archaeon]